MCQLPKPHYHPDAADPDWLAYAVQFHGHLGPWATAGLRAGMAARRAVDADGYFDLNVTAGGPFAGPPRSCFLDGLQVATGATLGKRNLNWIDGQEIVVRAENTRSGKVAEVRLTPALVKLMTSPKPPAGPAASGTGDKDHADTAAETIARTIAGMPEKEILAITFPGR